ncbi:MAG: AraC family transcriptional regulator [Polyangiaceae bacterium]
MHVKLVVARAGDRVVLSRAAGTLLLPLDTSVVEVSVGGSAHLVDRASWLVVPSGARASVANISPVGRTLVLGVTPALRRKVVETFHGEVDDAAFTRYLGAPQLLPRTTWVNEIAHRYLFERAVCEKRDNDATRFLETEIAKEIYFLCRDRERDRERSSIARGETELVERARAHLEAHLFDVDVLQALPRVCRASASTVLRAFKKELGDAPLPYLRKRRLDESLLLLKSKRHSVGEVAAMVGYGSFGAFSAAFRARFGIRPTDAREGIPPRAKSAG